MAIFDPAIQLVLRQEGQTYTAQDGNPTKFGLTQAYLVDNAYHYTDQQLAELTSGQARAIYQFTLWDKYPFAKVLNQSTANYLFDMGVNMGMGAMARCAQRAVWACTLLPNHPKDDGVFGDLTVAEINNSPATYLPVLRGMRIAYYYAVVEHNRAKGVYLDGWLNRAVENCT